MTVRAGFKAGAPRQVVSGDLFQIEKNTPEEWRMMMELKEQIA
jgi:hypothetical protein